MLRQRNLLLHTFKCLFDRLHGTERKKGYLERHDIITWSYILHLGFSFFQFAFQSSPMKSTNTRCSEQSTDR